MNDAGAPLSRFDLPDGTQLTLHRTCLVHRGPASLETLPLAAMGAAGVAFTRDSRKLGWAMALLVFALVLLLIAAPLGQVAALAASELAGAGTQGVARALLALFRMLEGLAGALPVIALVCAIGGAALGALGWRGHTLLTLTCAGLEREYAARGRDPHLMEFNEALSQRLLALER